MSEEIEVNFLVKKFPILQLNLSLRGTKNNVELVEFEGDKVKFIFENCGRIELTDNLLESVSIDASCLK